MAEARLVDVTVDGSLLVAADAVMGHYVDAPSDTGDAGGVTGAGAATQPPAAAAAPAAGVALPRDPESAGFSGGGGGGERLAFSSGCGRVHMMNVTVQNVGVDWHHPGNCYWRHQVGAVLVCVLCVCGGGAWG